MKKLLLSIAALAMSTTAVASSNMYNVNIPAGVIQDPRTGMIAIPTTTFGCTDEVYGEYDMCINVIFRNFSQTIPTIKMKTNINQKFTATNNRRILVRYVFSRKGEEGLNTIRAVNVRDADSNAQFLTPVPFGNDTYVTKSSTDGGVTWTSVQTDVR